MDNNCTLFLFIKNGNHTYIEGVLKIRRRRKDEKNMRHLFLLRGATGAGKTTLIENFGLEPFTLSADKIREQYANSEYSIDYDEEGKPFVRETIGANLEKKVWDTLLAMLEERMRRGQTTIIDATHSNGRLMRVYNKLVKEYRYRIFTVQLDVDLDTLLENNQKRPERKRVPDYVVEKKFYELERTSDNMAKKYSLKRFDNLNDAGQFILDTSTWRAKDMKDYDKVYVIGDIHSTAHLLEKFLSEHYSENNFYVFVGDYFDRGLEPVKTAELVHKLHNKENVVLLRGNHERNYERWLNIPENPVSEKQKLVKKKYKKLLFSSRKYIREVENQLDEGDFKRYRNKIKDISRRLQDVFIFEANGQKYVCTHGGIVADVLNYHGTGSMINFSADNMVRGIGKYSDDIDLIFSTQMEALPEEERYIQIHGHRNQFQHDVFAAKYSYNVEQDISNGGQLGIIQINTKSGETHDLSMTNDNYRRTFANTPIEQFPVSYLFEHAKDNDYINVKALQTVDDVYSVNFNREAFHDKAWSDMVIRARGLFLNPNEEKVVARSYNKFFNLNERPETSMGYLKDNLVFPVEVISKTNGFLGILTVHEGDFLFLSKSTDGSYYSKLFKETFLEHIERLDVNLDELKSFIQAEDVSLVFEVIHQEKDPHIIRYEENGVVLLDVFKNSLKEEVLDKYNIDVLQGFPMPEVKTVENWEDLETFINNFNKGINVRTNPTITGLGEQIDSYNEGVIINDKNNYKVKIKGAYYSTWKQVRNILKQRIAGNRGQPRTRLDHEVLDYTNDERHRTLTINVLKERELFLEWSKQLSK